MSEKMILDMVPFRQKMAYGTGNLVLNLLPAALNIFMFFLVTAFGMDPLMAGLLGGLPRLFDAITDPIMGFISDNTKSKWGRRRPYIVIGAILSGIIFALLWQLNVANSQDYNFWYFLIFSLIFTLGNTMYATPFVGLGYEMTTDYNERTRLMAFAQTMGQIAWMVVPWFWVLVADPDLFATQDEGVRKMAMIVGGACILLGILPGLFCKGLDASEMKNRAELNFANIFKNLARLWKSIKEISNNGPFLRLCGATFLVFNGFQLIAGFAYFIIVFHMFNGDYGLTGTWPAWFATMSAVATAFLVIPIISYISDKFGKRNAFIIATIISIVGYSLKWWGFNPDNPWYIFMPIPLMSFGIGGLFTLMMSMTADVCDLDELRNGMPRKEGTFGAIYWLMVKIGQALALILAGLVLKIVGFESGAATQTVEAMTKLRLADIIIPAVTAAIAIWVMWGYDLTEERVEEIKSQLIARRGDIHE
ncbi:glycoside/pentoside/hexuronide:cation symporter, GPH family [Ekhidna lutea]|uniref:Glycoside/pentoside/hexuronide:cation symporter, GPH family n=1 Tax=Ekhidna lutea TaxID=447679 RepID=A0A239LYC4_EKHLU|nr:MFS transporter [Ekhidna lutea]SNT34644.1 glycoside/pentoside/hexuronide:cation symporter, GPH family [Ekhidna lutea]